MYWSKDWGKAINSHQKILSLTCDFSHEVQRYRASDNEAVRMRWRVRLYLSLSGPGRAVGKRQD